MIPLALPALAKNWKAVGVGTLIIVAVIEAGAIRKLLGDLEKARIAYENPKTVEVVKTVRVEGPVRVRTVVVERPGGERETTTVEERAEVRESSDASLLKEPVPFDRIVSQRKVRFVVAADLRDLEASNFEAWTAYAGVSLANRVDLLAGAGKRDRWESHLMVAWRF